MSDQSGESGRKRLSPMLTPEQVEEAQEKALRRFLVRSIDPAAIEYFEVTDYRNDALMYDVRVRLRFSQEAVRREVPAAPDPLAQGIALLALAGHEAERARLRGGTTR